MTGSTGPGSWGLIGKPPFGEFDDFEFVQLLEVEDLPDLGGRLASVDRPGEGLGSRVPKMPECCPDSEARARVNLQGARVCM